MKRNKFIYLLVLIFMIALSCTKQNNTPTNPPVNNPVDVIDTSSSIIKYSASLQSGPFGTVSGLVKIYEDAGMLNLLLDSFNTSNGPDLHVYLSQEEQPIHFIDLGKLKSVNGLQKYEITGTPDFILYKYALIHCQLYNHLFGSSELMPR